jgi:hypothetical protein
MSMVVMVNGDIHAGGEHGPAPFTQIRAVARTDGGDVVIAMSIDAAVPVTVHTLEAAAQSGRR